MEWAFCIMKGDIERRAKGQAEYTAWAKAVTGPEWQVQVMTGTNGLGPRYAKFNMQS